jgi:catechol 2,3-dioxygenase-like lactoylglutathione lyase family enzyme
MTARLGLVILAVDDVPRAAAFYRGAFDWPASVETPVYVELALPAGLRLGLYERRAFARNPGVPPPPPPAGIAGTELYLYPDDLEPALARIEEAGARLLSPLLPRDWGDEAAYYADPDGHVVVLARPLPPAIAPGVDADEGGDRDPA